MAREAVELLIELLAERRHLQAYIRPWRVSHSKLFVVDGEIGTEALVVLEAVGAGVG